MDAARFSTGIEGLDDRLGGGLLPGTLTLVVGATGCGKTQLGIHFAAAGLASEGRRGAICDFTARGDRQSHLEYAQRLAGWTPELAPRDAPSPETLFDGAAPWGDYLSVFDLTGRRVLRRDLDDEDWQAWQAHWQRRVGAVTAFLYGSFVRGVRRVVFDGFEPSQRASESIQHRALEYLQHHVLQRDDDWVARELLRQDFRRMAEQVEKARYDWRAIASVALVTSREALLDELIARTLEEGDLAAAANTVIYLGRYRDGARMRRGLFVAKHRGSACSDEIAPLEIDERGLRVA